MGDTVFSTPGTTSFTVPAGGYGLLIAVVDGGGGGGDGGDGGDSTFNGTVHGNGGKIAARGTATGGTSNVAGGGSAGGASATPDSPPIGDPGLGG
jgi:hypothetical protein